MSAPPPPGGPFAFAPARLRLPAGHPFLEDGDIERHLSLQLQGALSGPAQEEEAAATGGSSSPGCAAFFCHTAGCGQTFSTLENYEHHYNLLHRNVCSSCKRPFPSAHLLDVHILEWHDSLFRIMAERQDMYQCLVESCAEKFKSSKDRKDHLIKVHQYPADFRFDKPVKCKSTRTMTSPSRDHTVPMDVNIEACGHSPGDAMETGPSETAAHQTPQPGMENSLVLPPPETRLSRSRVPPSICFGQGATRGFRSRKKRA